MSATAHLPQLASTRPPRERYLTRLRVRLRRDGLDRRIAAGEDVYSDADLGRRAAQLTEPDTRRRIAATIDRVIDEAAGPPAPFSSKVPLARSAIVTCAPRLCEIAGRLESDQEVAARGVAQAKMLVREGDSPLFTPQISDVVLNRRLTDVAAAL
ncbi:MAG TPA: hypothetical protein VN671_00635 [Solirubrobacterales bacterium]|nr:hypothetical protein [Solirubrobacterales bacterium]